ncbi:TPA: hypothetical protein RFW12_004353 [Klebsiella variicola]|nr:hypothetical protein [Klebsiella quasipneumoniae subsp. similipneumoniae]HDU5940802.1 hypothetical protein [Klebsiella variicola]
MDTFFLWVILKITTIFFGFGCVFMGYKLLVKGIFPADSDIEVGWDKDRRLVLRRASPGVIFAVIGFAIIGLTSWFGIYKGADVIARSTVASEQNSATYNRATNLQAEVKKDKATTRPAIKSNY